MKVKSLTFILVLLISNVSSKAFRSLLTENNEGMEIIVEGINSEEAIIINDQNTIGDLKQLIYKTFEIPSEIEIKIDYLNGNEDANDDDNALTILGSQDRISFQLAIKYSARNQLTELIPSNNIDEDSIINYLNQINLNTIFDDEQNVQIIKLIIQSEFDDMPKLQNTMHLKFSKAVSDGNLELVKLLFDGINVNKYMNNGRTLLEHAVWKSHFNIVEYLVNNGADINKRSKNKEWTPLIVAIKMRQFDMMKYLVESGANLNEYDGLGDTPLLMVANMGKSDLVQYLVKKGADTNLRNKFRNGETALQILASHGKRTQTRNKGRPMLNAGM